MLQNSSSQTIYPVEDKTSAITSPAANDRTLLNTVGGGKWQTTGQWLTYSFSVETSGLYGIAARFKQNLLEGMYTSRALYLYSDSTVAPGEDGYYNGIPFAEASRMQFKFDSDWQSAYFGENGENFEFYFKEGVVYTIKLEVVLGTMGSIVQRVQASLTQSTTTTLNFADRFKP